MTNRIAVVLAVLILIAIGLDFQLNGSEGSLFLGRKLSSLIEWLAFWR